MEHVAVYEPAFRNLISGEVQTVLLDKSEKPEVTTPVKDDYKINDTKTLSCSFCKVKFDSVADQRDHYKLDWHRYNLKRHLMSKDVISEEEFNAKYDDVSSISGSDTESEKEDGIEEMVRAEGKLFLKSTTGKVFSIYRCLLASKKVEIDPNSITKQLNQIHTSQKWTVFMLGGGHFAGAVFDKDTPILHKTFHCYTVRAGQGGSQSSRDNKGTSSSVKSAGASLRRYNEQAFGQHIGDIVEKWKEDIEKSSLIFLRAPGAFNKSILFGGRTPLLQKGDARLRYIPFSTRRATFSEVKRVHAELAKLNIYNDIETILSKYAETTKRTKTRNPSINRAKSRELVERPLPDSIQESSGNESAAEEHSFKQVEINFKESLQAFDETENKPTQKKKNKTTKTKAQKRQEQEKAKRDELIGLIKTGDLEKLKNALKTSDGGVNEVIDEEGNTFLHLSAFYEKDFLVEFLLENGGDVCAKNKKQQTPYTCTKNQDIREVFKSYANANPEKFNYNKAHIPVVTLTAEEAELCAEKKRLARKAKRDKEKEKRKLKEAERKEQQEMERFASLSDREKRALAAERRILSQSGTVTSRCFLCGQDISGKVPFEYLGNRFCTIDCLKAHRIKNMQILTK